MWKVNQLHVDLLCINLNLSGQVSDCFNIFPRVATPSLLHIDYVFFYGNLIYIFSLEFMLIFSRLYMQVVYILNFISGNQ